LDYAEGVTGLRGDIYSGLDLGHWRWGYSRWAIQAVPPIPIKMVYIDRKI